MHRLKRSLGLVLGMAVISAGCNDAGTGPNGAGLTAAEAAALAAQIDMLGSGAAGSAAGPQFNAIISGTADEQVASQSGSGTLRVTVDITAPCPHGGTLRLAGTRDASFQLSARRIESATNATATPTDCGVDVEGRPLFLNGTLTFGEQHTLLWDPIQYEGTAQHSGSISWRRASGESGTCVVNITAAGQFTQDGSQSSGSRLVQGSVCGHTVNESINWTWTDG